MDNKIVVYSKPYGEEAAAITLRIKWLQDGTIKPLAFKTPEGICYTIVTLYETVSLAFLRERGEGLRFKVRAKITEAPDTAANLTQTYKETYIYLAHGRFNRKNIVDGRYGHPGKEYIPVTLEISPDGGYELICFWVRGARYAVEKTCAVERRGSFRAGGVGVWHKVEARLVNELDDDDPNPCVSVRRTAALYRELNKWFVSVGG